MDNFDLRKYLAENRLLKEETNVLNFGPFKNVEYKQRPDGEIYLIATDSDNFRKIEDNLEYETDELTDEQISYLNNEVEKLANEMNRYLTSKGIDNEIYDDQLGYGQEIDNLVVAISKEDLPNLSENKLLKERINMKMVGVNKNIYVFVDNFPHIKFDVHLGLNRHTGEPYEETVEVIFERDSVIADHDNEGRDVLYIGKDRAGNLWRVEVYEDVRGGIEEVRYETLEIEEGEMPRNKTWDN